MSKYREGTLLAPTDLGASGTKDIELKASDIISAIVVRFKTTKASEAMNAPVPACIPRIELKDGSKILHSTTGYENQALGYYNNPLRQLEHGQHTSTLSEVGLYVIEFGRYLYDPILAFDPAKFDNPTLYIEYDEDAADTSVSANEMEVTAFMFDEKTVTPSGFLSAVEHKDYTQGSADSYEDTKLPTDRIIRQIIVRAYQDGYEPWYNTDEAKLTENIGKREIFDITNLEAWYRRQKAVEYPIRTDCQVNLTTSARTFYFPQTDYWAKVALMGLSADVAPYVNAASMRGGKASLIAGSAGQCIGIASGYLPWHCYRFALGMKDEIDDWYDPAGKEPNLRLRASTGASSATVQVVVEALHQY